MDRLTRSFFSTVDWDTPFRPSGGRSLPSTTGSDAEEEGRPIRVTVRGKIFQLIVDDQVVWPPEGVTIVEDGYADDDDDNGSPPSDFTPENDYSDPSSPRAGVGLNGGAEYINGDGFSGPPRGSPRFASGGGERGMTDGVTNSMADSEAVRPADWQIPMVRGRSEAASSSISQQRRFSRSTSALPTALSNDTNPRYAAGERAGSPTFRPHDYGPGHSGRRHHPQDPPRSALIDRPILDAASIGTSVTPASPEVVGLPVEPSAYSIDLTAANQVVSLPLISGSCESEACQEATPRSRDGRGTRTPLVARGTSPRLLPSSTAQGESSNSVYLTSHETQPGSPCQRPVSVSPTLAYAGRRSERLPPRSPETSFHVLRPTSCCCSTSGSPSPPVYLSSGAPDEASTWLEVSGNEGLTPLAESPDLQFHKIDSCPSHVDSATGLPSGSDESVKVVLPSMPTPVSRQPTNDLPGNTNEVGDTTQPLEPRDAGGPSTSAAHENYSNEVRSRQEGPTDATGAASHDLVRGNDRIPVRVSHHEPGDVAVASPTPPPAGPSHSHMEIKTEADRRKETWQTYSTGANDGGGGDNRPNLPVETKKDREGTGGVRKVSKYGEVVKSARVMPVIPANRHVSRLPRRQPDAESKSPQTYKRDFSGYQHPAVAAAARVRDNKLARGHGQRQRSSRVAAGPSGRQPPANSAREIPGAAQDPTGTTGTISRKKKRGGNKGDGGGAGEHRPPHSTQKRSADKTASSRPRDKAEKNKATAGSIHGSEPTAPGPEKKDSAHKGSKGRERSSKDLPPGPSAVKAGEAAAEKGKKNIQTEECYPRRWPYLDWREYGDMTRFKAYASLVWEKDEFCRLWEIPPTGGSVGLLRHPEGEFTFRHAELVDAVDDMIKCWEEFEQSNYALDGPEHPNRDRWFGERGMRLMREAVSEKCLQPAWHARVARLGPRATRLAHHLMWMFNLADKAYRPPGPPYGPPDVRPFLNRSRPASPVAITWEPDYLIPQRLDLMPAIEPYIFPRPPPG